MLRFAATFITLYYICIVQLQHTLVHIITSIHIYNKFFLPLLQPMYLVPVHGVIGFVDLATHRSIVPLNNCKCFRNSNDSSIHIYSRGNCHELQLDKLQLVT
jgi:hypothetical protein